MRINRGIASACGVALLAGAGALGGASPAYAANTNLQLLCNAGMSGYTAGLSTSSISGATASDTVTITGFGGVSSASVTLSGVTGSATISSTPATYTITGSSPSYIVFTVTSSAGGFCDGKSATLSINGGSPNSSSSSGASSAPPPVIQQFGKPMLGTCTDAAPISLNWGGAGSGGWGESWAQWMNGGNGGSVCTRTLVYSNNIGGWTVA